jgi:hypothetical protein
MEKFFRHPISMLIFFTAIKREAKKSLHIYKVKGLLSNPVFPNLDFPTTLFFHIPHVPAKGPTTTNRLVIAGGLRVLEENTFVPVLSILCSTIPRLLISFSTSGIGYFLSFSLFSALFH